MSDKENTASKQAWPRWINDIERLLPIRSQFILTGSVRDVFLTPSQGGAYLSPLLSCLWAWLELEGFQFIVVYDRVDGIRVMPQTAAAQEKASQLLGIKLHDGVMPSNLDTFETIVRKAATLRDVRVATVIDYASRLTTTPQTPEANEYKFFAAMEKLSQVANPVIPKSDQTAPAVQAKPLFNPVFWLLNRGQDIPSWFSLDSERIASISVVRPEYETRLSAAAVLAPQFRGGEGASAEALSSFSSSFAGGTDGMSLQAMVDISQLARTQGMGIHDVDDAVRCFKVGATENPWRKEYLKEKIRKARDQMDARVKGQHQASVKTIDILMRSVMGLTGAHAKSGGSRPRGVLFFAGPTGVGKTELAKTLTEILFGDERAYIRFDMSEFAEEHASARLLGAPPGYVGYEAGGELTNSVKQRPFSVILFDEIEKAHPRLLDKFLQILEDGRLTDGRGDTVYFSESVIVFTSNLGIFVEDENGERIQNVRPEDPYEEVEAKVRSAIEDHFKFRLSRPEILNRIGDNIVVFNFIDPDSARQILGGMLSNVVARVKAEHKLDLSISSSAMERVESWCLKDLSNGGRGVGNRLESILVNPLSRALFQGESRAEGSKVSIEEITEADRIFSVQLA
ncbi:MAG: ATP-dependent Clp protease ATP-binding subunit [Nitrospira sp.]|jgi:ATP-dependent Clp protease ATP-binding subunit ClpB|nr:ATP-dependent Clp protease ATP-binding subunit [Nitrospira sp.]